MVALSSKSLLVLPAALVACLWQDGGQEPGGHAGHGHAPMEAAEEVRSAVAVLTTVGESGVTGVVRFERQGDAVRVTGEVRGLSPGLHGFHVHQYGDLTDREKGASAGDHFSPAAMPHGRPTDHDRHVGDLGNLEADESGVARLDITDSVIRLNGPHAIVGRALVVHEKEDRFVQPTGDAGGRVAFGVVGIAPSEE